jgi:hypothetical protein
VNTNGSFRTALSRTAFPNGSSRTALPEPLFRNGFAACCEARLCLAVSVLYGVPGLRPALGLYSCRGLTTTLIRDVFPTTLPHRPCIHEKVSLKHRRHRMLGSHDEKLVVLFQKRGLTGDCWPSRLRSIGSTVARWYRRET